MNTKTKNNWIKNLGVTAAKIAVSLTIGGLFAAMMTHAMA